MVIPEEESFRYSNDITIDQGRDSNQSTAQQTPDGDDKM